MKTLTVDSYKRVRVPTAKPGQVFSFQPKEDGTVVLVPVKAKGQKEPFPPGSLLKYFTGKLGKERDELETILVRGCVQEPE